MMAPSTRITDFDCIDSTILVGPYPDIDDVIRLRIQVVYCLSRIPPELNNTAELRHRPFCYWEMPDPLHDLIRIVEEISGLQQHGLRVLVHCRLGLDRTGLVAIAYLHRRLCSTGCAIDHYRSLRNCRLPRHGALDILSRLFHTS